MSILGMMFNAGIGMNVTMALDQKVKGTLVVVAAGLRGPSLLVRRQLIS